MHRTDLLARLDELTRTDDLTGLPNRRAWDELLSHELASARRHGQPLSVAMLDLDHFKRYNDHHGHLAGDRLLRHAATAWLGHFRATDILARWGGEEFALLLPGCDGRQAAALIQRLRGTLPQQVTFSAGIATGDGSAPPERCSTPPTKPSTKPKPTAATASSPPDGRLLHRSCGRPTRATRRCD